MTLVGVKISSVFVEITLLRFKITLCMCLLHSVCRNHTLACRNHTHEFLNYTRACQIHTRDVVITLKGAEIPFVRVEITLMRVKLTLCVQKSHSRSSYHTRVCGKQTRHTLRVEITLMSENLKCVCVKIILVRVYITLYV
jgi:hypothetical protein